MNIIAPAEPVIAVEILDGERRIGVTTPQPLSEARTQLDRLRRAYIDSRLLDVDYDADRPVDDAAADRLTYAHTLQVAAALTHPDLPLVGWTVHAHAPDTLHGSISANSLGQARDSIAEFAKVLFSGAVEHQAEYGTTVSAPRTEWAGVQVEIQAFVSARHLTRDEQLVGGA